MNSQTYLYQIGLYLSWFETHVGIENGTNYFDINKHAERFFVPILNEIFDGNFERLEYEDVNYPALDLGDKTKKIGFQITSEIGYDKIKRTLEGFIVHKKYLDFDELYHLVIDKDYKTQKAQDDIDQFVAKKVADLAITPAPHIGFDIKKNLWNTSQLKNAIEQHCDTEKLQRIAEHLKKEYGRVTDLPSFDQILVPYQIAFDTQLDKSNNNLSYQLHNEYSGRRDNLATIQSFVEDREKILMISADGGYGKTRLCIEFFEKYVDGKDDIVAYVLVPSNYDGASFAEALKTEKKVVVLFDDAHNNPELLNQIIPILNRHSNAKMILTVRTAAFNDTVNSIASHQRRYERLLLDRLGYEETKALFKSQLPGARSEEIVSLTQKSNGVPIVILTMADAIKKGSSATRITEDEAFTRYVLESKKEAIDIVHEKTYVDKEKINKTIQLLSLLAPVNNSEKELIAISELNQISYEETEIILDALSTIGFIERRHSSIAIKPDPYSDIILIDSAARVKLWLANPGITQFKEKAVKNLVLVEHSGRLNLNVQGILSDFISHLVALARQKDYKALNNGLETLLTFTYKKPNIALYALMHLYPELKDLEEPDPQDFWAPSHLSEINGNIDKIFSIALLNSHGYTALKGGYDLLTKYLQARKNHKLLAAAFGYRIYDFYEYGYYPEKQCERQVFLLEEMEDLAKQDVLTEEEQVILLKSVDILLKLDFQLETFYEAHTGQYTYGIANVPANQTVSDIRMRSTRLLIDSYPKFSELNQNDTFTKLSHQLHFMRKPSEGRDKKYDQTNELKTIIPFLITQVESNPNHDQKGALMRKLDLFQRNGLRPEFENDFQSIKDILLRADTELEKMMLFLNHDYFYVKEHVNSEIDRIVAEVENDEAFFKLLIEAQRLSTSQDKQGNMGLLLDGLIKHRPDLAEKLLNYVVDQDDENAGRFTMLIKASYRNQEDFYKKITYFWDKGDQASKANATWMLIYGRNGDHSHYQASDVDYFKQILQENNLAGINHLVYGGWKYINIAPTAILDLLAQLFKRENGADVYEFLLPTIFEDEEITKSQPDSLKEFLFNHTIEIPLDHCMLAPLKFLEDYFGFDVMIEYLQKKMAFFDQHKELPAFFYGFNYHNSNTTKEKHEENFVALIERFIDNDGNNFEDLFNLLKPFEGFSENLATLLIKLIENHKDDSKYLLKLAKKLNFYDEPNQHHLSVIVAIGNILSNDRSVRNAELISIFPEGYYDNHGSRSKSGSGPFPQDVKKKIDIEKVLSEGGLTERMKEMFNHILSVVQRDIDRESTYKSDW